MARAVQTLDFHIVGFCLVAAAIFAVYPGAYLSVVVPALLPLYLWLRAGAPGIPTLPIVAGLSIIYYAAPVLRGEVQTDDTGKILAAALTVGGFLLSASVVYQCFLAVAAGFHGAADDRRSGDARIVELTFLGLASGIVFYVAFFAGWLDFIGSYVGVVRAVGLTLASIGCYLAGAAHARGELRGSLWAAAVICMIALALVAVGSLLLVGGIVNVLAGILGYVIAKRRIPWATLALTFAVISLLQAGKLAIRDKYWDADQEATLSEMPAIMLDWFESGFEVVWSGARQIDVLERASLLLTVIRVQEMTPQSVPYLSGETYALLPSIALPRFVEPDKIKSQAGLNLLAVRYGFQSEEGTDKTTIGFGLIAEAYANFGAWGVLIVGALFGALCGGITWLSTGVSPISLRMFIAIAATTALLNIEADFSYLLVTILQGTMGVLLAASLPFLAKATAKPQPRRNMAASRRAGAAGDAALR